MKVDLSKSRMVAAFSILSIGLVSPSWADVVQPMQMGDARLSCEQLIEQTQQAEAIIGGAPAGGILGSEQVANVGTGLAQRAVSAAGAGQAVGALGVVGGAFKGMSKKKKKQQAAEKAAAEKRWFYVVGLYQGNSCDSQPAAE